MCLENITEFYNKLNLDVLPASNDLLHNPEKLRQRLADDGYIYLNQILDENSIGQLYKAIIDIFTNSQLLCETTDPIDAIPSCLPFNEGEETYFKVYDQIQKLESFHALPHSEELYTLFRQLLGQDAFPHPLGVARLSFPDNVPCTTPPHQDYPNNQGTPELYACWIPLSNCTLQMGGLAVLPRSHKLGILPLEYSLGAGNRKIVLSDSLKEMQWFSTDYKVGDVLIFHSHTIHCSLPNQSNRLRLSVDYRYQRASEAMTKRCTRPHFERLSWEEIYQGWDSDKLKYYWHKLGLKFAPWSDSFHELSKEHLTKAVKLSRTYQKFRREPIGKKT